MTGRLFVCATPIGNLEDVTHRLLRVLGEVDLVAAEDTRRTRKLLARYDIRARIVSYHDANEVPQTQMLVERMRGGEKVALVTDSGTPTISDPGYKLVTACAANDVPIEIVPGPSAVIAAVAVSGLPTDRFAFEGFLPRRQGEQRRRLDELVVDERTLVFFEAPGRVIQTLSAIRSALGDRRMALVRELTKVHEEVRRGTVSEILESLTESPKGEVVLVIEGLRAVGDLEGAVREAHRLAASGYTRSRAAADAARRHKVPKAEVYEALGRYSGENGSQD